MTADAPLLVADRGLVPIAVTGPDRASYLDDVTTQQFTGRTVGEVVGMLVLDGKGVPRAVGWALVDEDRIVVLAPPAPAEHLLEVVAQRTFLAQVAFERIDAPVTSVAAADGSLPAPAGRAEPVASDRWVLVGDGPAGPLVVARHAFGLEVVGAGVDDVAEVLSVEDPAAVRVVEPDALSLASGEPRFGHEVVAGRLPEEYGLLATHVHLAKGCYPGQEPIAHMWMLGRPRRRLATVALAAPAHDDEVLTGHDGARGFAFVAPGAEVGEEVAAGVRVAAFVGAERDVVGWTPAQTRRRDRDGSTDLPARRAP